MKSDKIIFFAVLTCKICNFLLDMITFRIPNSLFQKTTARKNHTFFYAGKVAHVTTGHQMQLQNCGFPNFNLQILSSKSNLHSSFTNLFKLRKSENSIGWKRFGSFISLHLAYWRKSVCFCSFYETKHFFFFSKKKRSKSTRQTHFLKMSQTSFI